MHPDIAVVVPMLNAEDDIEVLLTSLLNQDFDRPWEIIAVDNSSDDNTVAIARNLLRSPLPANLVRTEVVVGVLPRGYATPRNAGVRATTAPLLAFCDADGAVNADWLTAIAHSLEDNSLVESVKFHTDDVSRRTVETAWFEQRELYTILGVTFATTAGLGCTRELFDDLGGFDPHFDSGGEDADFSLRARFQLGVEPVIEPTALLWTKVPHRRMTALWKGYRNARTEVRLYARHRSQDVMPPFGPAAVILNLRHFVIWLLALRHPDTQNQIRFTTEVGNLFGRLVWSVKFGLSSRPTATTRDENPN